MLFNFSYTMMIKIYVKIYLERERENIKFIGLVGPMGRRGCFSTFTVHLGLVGMTKRGLNCAYQVDANS